MYTIVGIDPGTTNTGVAVMVIDNSLQVLSIKPYLLSIAPYNIYNMNYENYTERLFNISARVSNLLHAVRPEHIAVETPFYNSLRPAAYGPLSELLYALKCCITNYDASVTSMLYTPSQIKTTVKSNAIGSKEDMLVTMLSIPEVVSKLNVDLNNITDHEVDAIAIAYTHLTVLRECPEWVL